MPSRGSYRIANREEGKVAQRDESFKSCVIALLIFLFLCIILLLASLPWRRNYAPPTEQSDEDARTAQHHHYEGEPKTRTTTIATKLDESILDTTTTKISETTTPRFETTEEIDMITTKSSPNDSDRVENVTSIETATETTVSTEPAVTQKSETEKQTYAASSTIHTNIIIESFSTTTESDTTTTEYSMVQDKESVTTTTESSDYTDGISTTEKPVEEYQTTTKRPLETSTESTEDVTTEIVENLTTEIAENVTTEIVENLTTEIAENVTTEIVENVRTTTIENVQTTTEDSFTESVTEREMQSATDRLEISESVCTTGKCKNLASKMLFYMNHTVDPCDDFYEYACGGFEANPQTVEQNLEDIAYQRISRQMEEETRRGKTSPFGNYYKSCLEYEKTNHTERIRLARKLLDRIGRFYTTESWVENHTSFTELLANLLRYNSAILFDVSPELDESSPDHFTLKIGPATYKNPFDTDETEDHCFASQLDREREKVDLRELHDNYKSCKNDTTKYIQSIMEALIALGVFNELNRPFNITQYINLTVFNIDNEIVQKFLANFPSRNRIREAYLLKTYDQVSIMELDKICEVVNWTQLIYLVTKEKIQPEVKVQVYFYKELVKSLRSLEEFARRDESALYNAALGLYARNLYHDLVLSNHQNAKRHCLHVATNLLKSEASNLYISSFSEKELAYMSEITRDVFDELKETLKSRIKVAEWATEEGRDALIDKIDNLRVAVPDVSYLNDNNSTYRKIETKEVSLSDNYFENSVNLMQRYRKLLYAQFRTNPRHPEQIWTHYATPFQTEGLAIYGLNLVVIPFGLTDWFTRYNDVSFNFTVLGAFGNEIARQIAHHFDANGIYYNWNGTRNIETSMFNKGDFTLFNIKDNIECHDTVYPDRLKMTLSTGQIVSYEISPSTLNERLSETIGLRLTHDTLDRLRSHKEILPWLEPDSDQLFYLTYAQMYCTKLPLTSSYIPMYENEHLPSRIRLYVSASNNRHIGETWSCREGSQLIPSHACDVFPYLNINEEITGVTV